MKTNRLLILLFVAITLFVNSASAQRGRRSRRITSPDPIHLSGGSRVEFHEFNSTALGGTAHYSIFLPARYDQDPDQSFPAIYVLHGMNNDHTTWTNPRYGNIPLSVEDLLKSGDIPSFVMVHPYGENPFFTDYSDGTKKYEEFINQELLQEIESTFRIKADRSNRSLAGTSLGGYGALKLAMKNPDLYSSVTAGSPIILLGEDPSQLILGSSSGAVRRFGGLFNPVFGTPFDQDHWMANSIESLARTADLKNLNIYFSYGTEDRYRNMFPMEKGLDVLDQILTERDIPHTRKVYQGEPHGWVLIQNHMGEILEFLTQTFTR
ncbi:MAG: alpha/beta hydrolase-fold protein [Acidobacteriota bacterium]